MSSSIGFNATVLARSVARIWSKAGSEVPVVRCRPVVEGDKPRIAELQRWAFTRERTEPLNDWELEGMWAAEAREGILAIARGEVVGQHFSGRAVPTLAISSVVVDPVARGRGLTRTLFASLLKAAGDGGTYLSTLYPSTLAVYRRLGYELGGAYRLYSRPINAIGSRTTHAVDQLGADDLDEMVSCYESFAATCNGPLSRSRGWWRNRVLVEQGGKARRLYGHRRDGSLRGYMVFTQEPAPLPYPGYSHTLACHDFVWLDLEAALSLLSLVESHRAMGTEFLWPGPADDPLNVLLTDGITTISSLRPWMTRLVDAAGAIEARGYPPDISAEFVVHVTDDLLSHNDRSILVEVDGGNAVATETSTSTPGLALSVARLAVLYVGSLSARDASRLGWFEGAPGVMVEALEKIFPAAPAWMMDLF